MSVNRTKYVENTALPIGTYTDALLVTAGKGVHVSVSGANTGLVLQRATIAVSEDAALNGKIENWRTVKTLVDGDELADYERVGAYYRIGGHASGTPYVRVERE